VCYLGYTDVRYYLLIIMSVSKPFFIVTQCCCPRGKSLSPRTNLQVLVLGLQVLVLVLGSHVLLLSLSSNLKSLTTNITVKTCHFVFDYRFPKKFLFAPVGVPFNSQPAPMQTINYLLFVAASSYCHLSVLLC